MNDYFVQSVTETTQVLSADSRITVAYALVLEMARGSSQGISVCTNLAATGLAKVPASFVIRKELMLCMEPRWGGSFQAMEKVAAGSESMFGVNPRLKILKGMPAYSRAQDASASNDFRRAVSLYTKAIAAGDDYYTFYRDRAYALQRLGRYIESLADLERAQALAPQDSEILTLTAYSLADLGRENEALMKLNTAAQFNVPSSDAERLRQLLDNTAD